MARKPPPLHVQLDQLHAERDAATQVFVRSATILEETAGAFVALADQARAEAQLRDSQADTAQAAALDARAKAVRIRELVG